MSNEKVEEIFDRIVMEFKCRNESLTKRETVIRDALVELANIKITIWNFLKIMRLMKRVIAIIGAISTSSITMSSSINDNQVHCIRSIRTVQKQIETIRKQL
ncbi:MAG: hypothetical protein ACXADW_20865 [Candidatus Hodarchaeales archaeon]|jgi:hypothetical protein